MIQLRKLPSEFDEQDEVVTSAEKELVAVE